MKLDSKVLKRYGWYLMVLGVIFAIVETYAYGNHGVAASIPEAITDFMAMMVVAIGYVLYVIGKAVRE